MQKLLKTNLEPDQALANSLLGRVSVMRGLQLVPLLATSPSQHLPRQQPWKGVVIERHAVRRGEIPEHQHPTLCLHLQVSGNEDFEWWQDGKKCH
jgi:AraC family transcriptional regulator